MSSSILNNRKILQISNEPGPLRCFMQPMCQLLRDRGAAVELACVQTGANFKPLAETGFPLHAMKPGTWTNPGHWLGLAREVRRILQKGRFDIVVVHTPVMSWIVRFVARGCATPVVYFAHGLPFVGHHAWWRRLPLRTVERSCARYTTGLIVINAEDMDAARKYRLTRSGENVFMVPGVGVDADHWAQPLTEEESSEVNAIYDLRPDRPLVLYLGRLIASKRPFDLLALARRVGDRADFLMAGEGPLYGSLKREADRLGRHVQVREWTEHGHSLVRRSDLAFFPSVFREGLPVFVQESQAAGKPVVAYDVRGTCDIVVDGQTGRLARPCDVDAIVSLATDLLDDQTARERMGVAGQERIRREFSIERSLSAQLAALEAVIQST